jgi:glycosyltransferase involved in cell wall biosynthesis
MPAPDMSLPEVKISVVIPTYNRSKTIGYCLRSVLEQTYAASEIIIVDDKSTDDTVAIVRQFNDPRIMIIEQPVNQGAQAARNTGIKAAKNLWIALQDSDDEWLPNRLEEGVKALQSVQFAPFTMVHSNCYLFFEATQEKRLWELPLMQGTSQEVLPKILAEPGPMFQGLLTSKKALEAIGLLDEQVPSYQEWDTSIRLAQVCQVIHIRQPLFIHYFHEGDRVSTKKYQTIKGFHFNRLKHKELIIKVLGRQFYDENVRWNIERAFDAADFGLAAQLIKQTYTDGGFKPMYLMLLATLGLKPRKVRRFIDPFRVRWRRLMG